jgi:hypothetical protein
MNILELLFQNKNPVLNLLTYWKNKPRPAGA